MNTTAQVGVLDNRHSWLHRLLLWRRARAASADPHWGSEPLGTFMAGVAGSYPRAADQGVILAACDDRYYWKFAITMLLSIEMQAAREQVHLHLYEPSPETLDHLGELSRRLEHVQLSWTTDDCRLARTQEFRVIYLACARFLLASTILARMRAPVLCVDIDAIALKPVWQAYAGIQTGADVALFLRPNKKQPTRKVLASAVGFSPGDAGVRFASTVARAIASSFELQLTGHVDQIILFYAVREMRRRGLLTVAQMPKALSDFDFDPDSVIWTAKGSRKNSGPYIEAKLAIDARFPEIAQRPPER